MDLLRSETSLGWAGTRRRPTLNRYGSPSGTLPRSRPLGGAVAASRAVSCRPGVTALQAPGPSTGGAPEPDMSFASPARLALEAVMVTAVFGALIFGAQVWLWPLPGAPHTLLAALVYDSTSFWALPLVPAALGLVGFLVRGPEARSLGADDIILTRVCFRIVTRGINVDALRRTVLNVHSEMEALSLFPFFVQVVSEIPLSVPGVPGVEIVVVPTGYRTAKGSRYKARALQYVLETSPLAPDTWIVHLDEESHIGGSTIRGIRDAVQEEEASGRYRIGQGCILYHRDVRRHPFLTLADSLRTADDLGRFRLQFNLGLALLGLHGSFIVVRNSVEARTGFDVGPEGSVTEDTYWALLQMAAGARFRWVRGYVVEQSTQSVGDFIKQRRRWFVGVAKVVRYADIGWAWKAPMAVMLAIWSAIWVFPLVTVGVFACGISAPAWVRVLGDSSLAIYLMQYLVGCRLNMRHHRARPACRAFAYAAQILLVPVFALMESLGALYGLLSPDLSFHVVKK